ncbi:FecR domain-containing protein [Aestuariibacter sp. A3R04]|uniref:FecR family protein n=1 Tax=Aestuariibacter sp. A3R04 TaxID=2841571 RepID=UPI001C09D029|nr:FecR domain-containing protein [Aestuariibacter sp. A3R04]MBU3020572.1 FecR domain-containing protein [Aestuariibacter sp. A3R04]
MTESAHLEQAAEWFDRLNELNEQEKEALSRWLSVPEHQRAFQRIATAMGHPELVSASVQLTAKPRRVEENKAIRGNVYFWMATAASLVLVSLLAFVWSPTEDGSSQPSQTVTVAMSQQLALSSKTAQTASTVLLDGSVVYLNGDSVVAVNHNAQWRDVRLEKGQAYFDVSHEPSRPFVVHVDDTRVQVVGTAFDIDRLTNKTVISVYDGVVKVMADKTLMLVKGEGVVLKNGKWHRTFRLSHSQLPAWRSGWLDVENEPLAVVLERLGRYLEKPVKMVGIEQVLLSGRFNLNEPEQSLKLLTSANGLVLQDNGGQFVISTALQ